MLGLQRDTDQAFFFFGTFFPAFRAFESPMAMACLRLLIFPALPPGPLFALPRLKRFISFFTAADPPERDAFRAAMTSPFCF
jgi:hypothetical protein